jgi:hypothetical protein
MSSIVSFALSNGIKDKVKEDCKMLMHNKSSSYSTLSTKSQDYLINLQQINGNEAIRLLNHHNTAFDFTKVGIQPKFKVSHPGDTYEQEADRVAEQVMRMSIENPITPAKLKDEKRVNRKCSACELRKEKENELNISRKYSTTSNLEATGETASEIKNILTSTGSPLDSSAKEFMESRFNYDFSNVRIHTDKRASKSANSVNALAYTMGRHIVFGEGQYLPDTLEGRTLLAHELTHVVQQREKMPHTKDNNIRKLGSEFREKKEEIDYISKSPIENLLEGHYEGETSLLRQSQTPAPAPGVNPPNPPLPPPSIKNWPPKGSLSGPPPKEYSSYDASLLKKLADSYTEHQKDESLLANSFWGQTVQRHLIPGLKHYGVL